MKHILPYFLLFLGWNALNAQCPAELLYCTPAEAVFCDSSANNALLWNAVQYSDPTVSLHDLGETPVDLRFRFRDSCGGAAVSFVLLLDLNGDGVRETALTPEHFLDFGKLLFNNAGTPGYDGGDTVAYDSRPVWPVNKYRFVLDTLQWGDTTELRLRWAYYADPGARVLPELPYGEHKVVWTLQRPDSTYVCESAFTVKDCGKPTVVCFPGLSVNIMPTGMITLWATDFLQYTLDNYTPDNLLTIGIVESDQSTGTFPIDSIGNPLTSVTFDCSELGPQAIQLWSRDVQGNAKYCETSINVQNNGYNCGDPTGFSNICMKTETGEGIENVSINIVGTHPALPPISYTSPLLSDSTGCVWLQLGLPLSSTYKYVPLKDDNPLNGVTTYDLILIAKHILGLQPIASPYKMIAADANKSNSITTFDIVEFRKLILEIYTEFPYNTSWRFVDKAFVFTDPQNPFSGTFPEFVSGIIYGGVSSGEFVGIKIGDLNGSALAHSFTDTEGDDRAAAYLQVPERYLQAGETIELPLYAAEAADWEGFQFSMRYDSELLELESVEPGVLPDMDADNFNAAVPGVLNASWFSLAAQPVGPAMPLCMLRLRALAPLRTQDALWLDESGSLRAEAYDAGGPRRLGLLYKNERGVSASARPNPTTAGFEITLDMPAAGALEFVLSDALGRVRYRAEYALGAGVQTLQAPAEAMPEAGLYFWSVQCGGAQWQGRVVKE